MSIKSLTVAVSALVLSTSVNAALYERLGGQAYYDDVADLTWLADANYAMTSGYDADGMMNWYDSMSWAASLNINGVTGWRLPNSDYCIEYGCTGSDMGNLYHAVLLNPVGAFGVDSFTNAGPFTNLPTDDGHWSATDVPGYPDKAFDFFFLDGSQNDGGDKTENKSFELYAWAVHDGDVGALSMSPSVTGIWPGNAPIGTTTSLFIFGDFFNAVPGATQVYINGIQQFIVQVVTPEMLIARVTVTSDMIGGPVTVITPNGSAVSLTSFGVPTTGLQVTGVWPSTITEGVTDSVFVFGSEFDLAPGATEVYFNGVQQWIVQVVTPEMLIVRTTPTTALSGPITVTTPAGTAMSSTNLVVVP